jgi:hypothetical protein
MSSPEPHLPKKMPTVLRLGSNLSSSSNLRQPRSDANEQIVSYPSLVDTKQTEKGARKFERFRAVQKGDDNLPIISTEQYEVDKKKSGSRIDASQKHFTRRSNVSDPLLNWTRPPQ